MGVATILRQLVVVLFCCSPLFAASSDFLPLPLPLLLRVARFTANTGRMIDLITVQCKLSNNRGHPPHATAPFEGGFLCFLAAETVARPLTFALAL